MSQSNFGAQTGKYLGVVLLAVLVGQTTADCCLLLATEWLLCLQGGVEAPVFHNIEALVITRALCRALPVLMIPYLVPLGSPKTDAGCSVHAAAAAEEDAASTRKQVSPTASP